jgi:hypothetical protein
MLQQRYLTMASVWGRARAQLCFHIFGTIHSWRRMLAKFSTTRNGPRFIVVRNLSRLIQVRFMYTVQISPESRTFNGSSGLPYPYITSIMCCPTSAVGLIYISNRPKRRNDSLISSFQLLRLPVGVFSQPQRYRLTECSHSDSGFLLVLCKGQTQIACDIYSYIPY